MSSWGLPWTLSAETAMFLRLGLAASLLLLACRLARRRQAGIAWEKRLLQTTAALLCLAVGLEWFGAVEALRQQGAAWWLRRLYRPVPAGKPPAPTVSDGLPPAAQAARTPPRAAFSAEQTSGVFPPKKPVPRSRKSTSRLRKAAASPTTEHERVTWPETGVSAGVAAPRSAGTSASQKRRAAASAAYWNRALLVLWLGGTAALILWQLAASVYWLLRHRGRCRFVPPDDPLADVLREAGRKLGLNRLPSVRIVPWTESPMLAGVWRPRLLLPEAFSRLWSPAQQRAVLAHELAHLAHRDQLWQVPVRLAVALLWWHPGTWRLLRRWRWCAELAADDAAARFFRTGVPLAEALLVAAKQMTRPSRWPGWRSSLAFRSPLGNRIHRLLQEDARTQAHAKQPSRWSVCACAALGLLLTMAPAAVIAASPPPWTGEPAMRTAPWWRRPTIVVALLGLTSVSSPAQDSPRGAPPPKAPQGAEARQERPPHPPGRIPGRPFRPERVRQVHHGLSPEERLERLVRIAEELQRLGLPEEAEHMRRRAEEFKMELEHRRHFRGPEHAGPARPHRPRVIRRPEFRPAAPPHPPAEIVEELVEAVHQLKQALHETRRELERSRRHFQHELTETRRHLERVTERLERLERLRDQEEERPEEE